MSSCVVCEKPCIDVSDVKCSGGCGGVFHQQCIAGSDAKKLRSCKEWKCKECRKSSSGGSLHSGSSVSNTITEDFILNVMEGFKKEFFDELKQVRAEMTELRASVQFVSETMDTSNKLMESIKTQFADLRKENEQLKKNNTSLTTEVNGLKERLRNLEQYSRRSNVEVSGIPATQGEDIPDLVRDVGAALGVELREGDVAAAHRVPAYKRDRDPSLIVQFRDRATRDLLIAKYREKKVLTAKEINRNFPSKRVYVNDHLSPENKQFLGRLKQKCRDIGFNFAWSRDGKFFARKSPGDKVIKVNSYADIENLK